MADYDYAAIIHVGEAGLEYADAYEDVRFINFETCGQNAAAHFQNPNALTCVAQHILRIDQSGFIQHTVEFFTRPSIVVVLDSEQQLQRLRFSIEQMGWRVG